MFIPSIMIEKMTVKWTMVVSIFCYSINIASQFYPKFYTLLPTAFVNGLGAAPMWTAQCTYLTHLAHSINLIDVMSGLLNWRGPTQRL